MRTKHEILTDTRLEDEYFKWSKRRANGADLEDAFIAGWMSYARIAAKEWPDCKIKE